MTPVGKPIFWNNRKRYYDLKSYWINRFGCRVHKLPIDAGFTCPNRDGSVAAGGCVYCDGRGSALRQAGSLPSVGDQVRRGKAFYRKRGKAEGHMGEFMDVLAPALSSASRSKSNYRGRKVISWPSDCDAFARNEAILLLNLLAYEVLHAGRCLMEAATGDGWSLRRMRERVLKAAARVLLHGRRVTMVIAETAAVYWNALWPGIEKAVWPPA